MAVGSDGAPAAQVEVAAILEGLRAEVRAQRMARGQLEPPALERDLERALDEIELYRVVSAHWPLTGGTLPRRAVNLVNKVVRRYLRWYINPIVEQQNAYNDAVARALRLLADAYTDLREQLAKLQEAGESGNLTLGDKQMASQDAGPHIPAANRHPSSADPQSLMAMVRERAAAEPPARFADLELRALEPHLRLREQISAHWPLGGATLPQRAVALANKLVRRYLRWYINPVVEQQNSANAALTVAIAALIRLDAERRAQVATLRARR